MKAESSNLNDQKRALVKKDARSAQDCVKSILCDRLPISILHPINMTNSGSHGKIWIMVNTALFALSYRLYHVYLSKGTQVHAYPQITHLEAAHL